MKEIFMHYIWNFKLFSFDNLQTFHGDYIEVYKTGSLNHNSGPDFTESEIMIGNKFWIGSVEIHLNSSDWDKHGHSKDPNYENVILHVVWNHDVEIDFLRQRNVQTLILKDFVKQEIVDNYKNIIDSKLSDIYCKNLLSKVDLKQFSFWFEGLLVERFEEKTKTINKLVIKNKGDWEATLFKSLAINFGLKINAEAFDIWSNSFPFSILQKNQFNPLRVEALFFGQAGFLNEDLGNDYQKKLKNEYNFLKNKYHLESIHNNLFKFFRIRPIAFPTIRIAQLASVYSTYKNLFSEIKNRKSLDFYYDIFDKLELNTFWDTHYTFHSESKFCQKKISKDKINNILINTIIPLIYAYEKERQEVEIDFYIEMLNDIKAEKNSILTEYEKVGFLNKTAKDSQQLIQLNKNYCSQKKCLNCIIGQNILR